MTDPNPFNGTDSLKNVIDAVSQVIGGQPTVPDTYDTHIDAAAEEISKIDGPHVQGDITKIMQKHFNAGSDGKPQATELQKAFEKEVGKKVNQTQAKAKWEEH
tara:strand:+ start:546 stop:854 length:309 start_codon:yes stop_codon:yes gene_type:complete